MGKDFSMPLPMLTVSPVLIFLTRLFMPAVVVVVGVSS